MEALSEEWVCDAYYKGHLARGIGRIQKVHNSRNRSYLHGEVRTEETRIRKRTYEIPDGVSESGDVVR